MDTPSQVKEREAAAVVDQQGVSDRRRPGRIENISPHLIPLLRRQTVITDVDLSDQGAAKDDLRLPKGIAFGILLAIPLWGLIFAGVSLAIR